MSVPPDQLSMLMGPNGQQYQALMQRQAQAMMQPPQPGMAPMQGQVPGQAMNPSQMQQPGMQPPQIPFGFGGR